MAVGHGSDIKIFVDFNQLRDEILNEGPGERQCAYHINSEQRCLERIILLDEDWLLAEKFFSTKHRDVEYARRSRQRFLCSKHFDHTSRTSAGFFFRAGWCSRLQAQLGVDAATIRAPRSPLQKKRGAQLIVALKVPSPRLQEITTTDSTGNLKSPNLASPVIQPPQPREKRPADPESELTPRKRHKPNEKASNIHIDCPPQSSFSITKLSALFSSSHTDFRGVRRSERSIDHTPKYRETLASIVQQDRNECIAMAAKTLQRCRRPIVVDKLKDQLKCASANFTPTPEYLWDMIGYLLCEKHASEQARYTVLQRWCIELEICIDGQESPVETLPTPATSIAPSSPQARSGENYITLDSDDDAMDDQSSSTAAITSTTLDGPPTIDERISTTTPPCSSPNPYPNRPLARDFETGTEQLESRPSPRVLRRNKRSIRPTTASIHQEKEIGPETLNSEAEMAPEASTEERIQSFQATVEEEPDDDYPNETSPNDVVEDVAEAPTVNPDLEDPDMAILSVDDTEPDPISWHMPWEAYQAVKDEMLTPIDQEGFVYVMRSRSRPGVVKIGKAVNIKRRLEEIKKACKLDDLETVRDTRQGKIYHVAKLERLCHEELKIVQKADFKCNNPDHASKGGYHREWFAIDGNEAVKVVQRWRKWLKSKPYGDVRIQNLKEGWVHKIEDHFPEPEEDENDVHDHGRRHQKLQNFMNLGFGI